MTTIYGQGLAKRVTRPDIALPGMFLEKNLTLEAVNLADETAQVLVLKLTAATGATEYKVTLNGLTIAFTTPATITMADLQTLLLDKIQIQPEISGSFSIEKTGSDSLTLTAQVTGITYPFAGTPLVTVTQSIAALSAGQLGFGRVVTGRKKFIDKIPVCGAPTATTQKRLGVTQRSHGGFHDLNGPDGIDRGEVVSLVTQGQGWIEFESMIDDSIDGSLFYRAVPSAAQLQTGKLVYAASAPVGFAAFPGTIDSESTTIADGRIVALVSFSMV